MSHPNALLAERSRLQLAKCVVDDGWPLQRAAERFQVSAPTAARWAGRYRELGEAGMEDRGTDGPKAGRTADTEKTGTGPAIPTASQGPEHGYRPHIKSTPSDEGLCVPKWDLNGIPVLEKTGKSRGHT